MRTLTRRQLLSAVVLAGAGTTLGCSSTSDDPRPATSRRARTASTSVPAGHVAAVSPELAHALQALERRSARRIGVSVARVDGGHSIGYRAAERFAVCSTYKLFAVAAVLHRARDLDTVIHYLKSDLVAYSPVTMKHVETGMSLRDLCAAAIEVSDNTAANLLLQQAGGPGKVTSFLRATVHDDVTHLDRYEPAVNQYVPGDDRDTSTPAAMASSYLRLSDTIVLPAARATLMRSWLHRCTTGLDQIRKAAPRTWTVGDKTGHGDHGTTNDVAVLTPPGGTPLAIAVLTNASAIDAANRNDVVYEAARLVLAHLT